MSRVISEISMSLDGFVTGPNVRVGNGMGDGGDRLHDWKFDAKTETDAAIVDEIYASTGAVLIGKRMFDVGFEPWGDPPPFGMPVFIVTHEEREPLPMQGGTTYTFVTDGIEAALELARAAAGDKNVGIWGGANIMRQYLKAGLLDEMQIHLIPILLGGGVRLFEDLDPEGIELQEDKLDRDTGRHPLPIRSGEVTHATKATRTNTAATPICGSNPNPTGTARHANSQRVSPRTRPAGNATNDTTSTERLRAEAFDPTVALSSVSSHHRTSTVAFWRYSPCSATEPQIHSWRRRVFHGLAEMVSIAAAADHYDVSQQTVRRWIASGRITAHRVGPRLIRVDLDEIEAKIIHTVPTVDRQS